MEKEHVSAELNIALLIQTAMLPSTAIINERLKDLHLSALMHPAQEVGGDLLILYTDGVTEAENTQSDF